jgi:hypothetical protein
MWAGFARPLVFIGRLEDRPARVQALNLPQLAIEAMADYTVIA